jgi:hypothetical protein
MPPKSAKIRLIAVYAFTKTVLMLSVNLNRSEIPITKVFIVVSNKFKVVFKKVALPKLYCTEFIAVVNYAGVPLTKVPIG